MRILAVDPGDKRIGLAISDTSGTIARPLAVIKHVSRQENAKTIVGKALELEAEMILVGLALDSDGEIGPQARKALRLVEALRSVTEMQIETWDETDTTRKALRLSRKPDDFIDARAAAVFLQDYLDVKKH